MVNHNHRWMPYILGSEVCSICGINKAEVSEEESKPCDHDGIYKWDDGDLYCLKCFSYFKKVKIEQ